MFLFLDVNKAFSILTKKLENLERERHKKSGFGGSSKREEVLKYEDFEKLFEFDLGKVLCFSKKMIK